MRMDEYNTGLIYFSPTGTTQKILKEIAKQITGNIDLEVNLTLLSEGKGDSTVTSDVVLIGMPVYKGRIPEEALDRLKGMQGNNTPTILVVMYGNREYEDAMLELSDVATAVNFNVMGAAAFIGEHSYSTAEFPLAVGRPDQADLLKAKSFALKIMEKLKDTTKSDSDQKLKIPGDFPYKDPPTSPPASPEIIEEKCGVCGVCKDVCPVNAIDIGETIQTNSSICIWCCACVKACPSEARVFDHPVVNHFRELLFKNCSRRKEPEFYLISAPQK